MKHRIQPLVTTLFLLTACGGSGGGSKPAPAVEPETKFEQEPDDQNETLPTDGAVKKPATKPSLPKPGTPTGAKEEDGKETGTKEESKETGTKVEEKAKTREWVLQKPQLNADRLLAVDLPAVPAWIGSIEGLADFRQKLIQFLTKTWDDSGWTSAALLQMQSESLTNMKNSVYRQDDVKDGINKAAKDLWQKRFNDVSKEHARAIASFERQVAETQKRFQSHCSDSVKDALRHMAEFQSNAVIDQIKQDITKAFACDVDLISEFYPEFPGRKAALAASLSQDPKGAFGKISQAFDAVHQQVNADAQNGFALVRDAVQDVQLKPVPVDAKELRAAAHKALTQLVDKELIRWYRYNDCKNDAKKEEKPCRADVVTMLEAFNKPRPAGERPLTFELSSISPTWVGARMEYNLKNLFSSSRASSSAIVLDNSLALLWPERSGEGFYNSLQSISYFLFDGMEKEVNLTSSLKWIGPNIGNNDSLGNYINDLASFIPSQSSQWLNLQNINMAPRFACLKAKVQTVDCQGALQEYKQAVDEQLNLLATYRKQYKDKTAKAAVFYIDALLPEWNAWADKTQQSLARIPVDASLGQFEQSVVNNLGLSAVGASQPFLVDGNLNSRNFFIMNWMNDISENLTLVTGSWKDDLNL